MPPSPPSTSLPPRWPSPAATPSATASPSASPSSPATSTIRSPPASTFDLIVSNPPYLAPDDRASPETAFEPRAALLAGADGLDVIRRIIAGATDRLTPGGHLLIEIGAGQADAVLALATAAGLQAPRVEPDLAGIPRLLVAQRPRTGRGG